MSDNEVPLAELVDAVRRGARVRSHALARDEPLQFEVGDVELDLEITTSRSREGSAGLGIWVVNLGGKLNRGNTATQRVKVKLAAVGPDGARYKVSDAASAPVRTS